VHLVGFIIRIYNYARSSECQIRMKIIFGLCSSVIWRFV